MVTEATKEEIIADLHKQLSDVVRELNNLQERKDALIQRIDELGGEEYWRKILG